MKHYIALSLLTIGIAGCVATQGWFHAKPTQMVIADGCAAAAKDDTTANAALNAMLGAAVGAIPELAAVKDSINIAHLAIQKALADCVSTATTANAPITR